MANNRENPEFGPKTILQSDALHQYLLETSVYPREPEPMKELRELTAKHPMYVMGTSPDEAQFLSMLLKIMNAKNTMEIGVFTGYSILATALALPHDGKILAIDTNRDDYEIGLPIIKKAGVAHKIDFKEGKALPILDQMVEHGKYDGTLDFIFVDADKNNYVNYHERVMKLIKVGGVIGYDNTLWFGSVAAPPDTPLPEMIRRDKKYIMEFNNRIAGDPRVDITHLSVGDGITLCRRLL